MLSETFTSKDPIYLKYFMHQNFGDGINPQFFAYFTQRKIIGVNSSKDPCILGIGSILRKVSTNDIVYGTGLIQPLNSNETIKNPKQIISVRGPLTRNELLKKGISCPELYGDPAILLPFCFSPPSVNKKYKLGIIPHYADQDNEMLVGYHNQPEVLVIDIVSSNKPEKFIKDICSCQRIISSSLHGIIVADAYNIPSGHMKISDNVVGNDFKFRDYYESCNRSYYQIMLGGTIDDIIYQIKPYKCAFKLTELIERFPFIDEEIRNRCLQMLRGGFMQYLR